MKKSEYYSVSARAFNSHQSGKSILVVESEARNESLPDFMQSHTMILENDLLKWGGILFRGFGVDNPDLFKKAILPLIPKLSDYFYRSTPRQKVAANVYTSTEYPADQCIPLHNENAYSTHIPDRIAFCCIRAAQEGGETPIADCRTIYSELPERIRHEFSMRKVKYIRHYGAGLDLPWQETFQTQSRVEVEKICDQLGLGWQWEGDHQLRTWQICDAVSVHPLTKENIWLNQAHLFHYSTLQSEIQEYMLAEFGMDKLPRNSWYGDGLPINPDDMANINRVYLENSIMIPWEEGDVLLLDNRLMAHGRQPFTGKRQVIVAMGNR